MDILQKMKDIAGGKAIPESIGRDASPASPAPKRVAERGRIPMTLPMLKLQVPDIPGFVLQWHLDQSGQIQRAQRAGWDFVTSEEVELNQTGLGADPATDGNTDLGTRVSLHGSTSEHGQSERLYLMKQRQEWWDEDRQILADRNESVAAAIRGGTIGTEQETPADRGARYVKGASAGRATPRLLDNMFTPKRR